MKYAAFSIFIRNICQGNIIDFQKFLQIAVIADQHDFAEFPGMDVLETGHLFAVQILERITGLRFSRS